MQYKTLNTVTLNTKFMHCNKQHILKSVLQEFKDLRLDNFLLTYHCQKYIKYMNISKRVESLMVVWRGNMFNVLIRNL
jgi:hypothetical protein